MPVSRMDEYLAHQTPDTFDRVYTSDRNFYDRHYLNVHGSCDEVFLVAGLGQYPNLGVTDAFVTASMGERQYTVRASRVLGADRLDTSVGPFRIEVIEPLVSLRLVCEPTEWDVAFDLVWTGRTLPLEEPRIFRRRGARIESDTSRFAQVGSWQGVIHVAGREFTVEPESWRGARDRSWGVRPVGAPEPPGYRGDDSDAPQGFFHHWIPMQFDDYMIKVMIGEDALGNRHTEEAVRVWNADKARDPESLGSPTLEVDWIEGTREIRSTVLRFSAPATPVATITPVRTVYLNAGSGYVYDGYWGHGVYQGPLVVEGLVHDLDSAEARRAACGLNETLCRIELDTGEVGYSLHENMVLGAHLPSGFGPDDASLGKLRG